MLQSKNLNVLSLAVIIFSIPFFEFVRDNINEILSMVEAINTNAVQINTIGVGRDFIRQSNDPKYQFLKLLAQKNGGFFVGF